jgi:hypothetical protein
LRATSAIQTYFASLVDSPVQDYNFLLFRGYEQQGSNFLANVLPAFKGKLGDPPWSAVVETLGTLLDTDAKANRYDHKQSGTLRRSFFQKIKTKRGGKELIAVLKQHSLRGRNGWQLLWQMMRGCAALKPWGYDFGRALRKTEVIEFLGAPVPVAGDWALATWIDRREHFSELVNGLTGIGWNTFDYILRERRSRIVSPRISVLPVPNFIVSTNFCATWKSPKSTAKAGDGENPSNSPTRLSLGSSPVHSANTKSP